MTNFESFFNAGFKQELLEQESCRKKAANQQVFGGLLILLSILFIFFIFKVNTIIALVVGISGFIFGAYLSYQAHEYALKLKDFFKQRLIPAMVQNLNPNLNYSHEGGVSRPSFSESKIFQNTLNIFETEDWVKGRIGQTDIEFSEVLAQYETRDSDGNKSKHTIFKGIFFISDFHKDFQGETYVLRDQAQRVFGSVGTFFQRINALRPELIQMEDPVFEKQFVVYSTDQIESRYIITPVLMERMTQMNKAFRGIQFSFINSKMFVSIPFSENLFEPKLHTSFHHAAYIEKYFNVLKNCIQIVDLLNLNERIWTKN